MSVKRFVRYGTTADAKYIEGIRDKVDVLVLGANMAVHASKAVSSFLCTSMRDVAYIIDPFTHAFQHDISKLTSVSKRTNKVGLKASWRKLLKEYGLPCTIETESKPLRNPLQDAPEIVDRVVNFQRTLMDRELNRSPDKDLYMWLENQGQGRTSTKPYGIVAPYFFPEEGDERKWIDINAECLKRTGELLRPGEKLLAEVLVPDVGNTTITTSICTSLRKVLRDHENAEILLWLDKFDEHEASISELKAYVALVRRLGGIAPVSSLFGGYFSIACGQLHGQPHAVCHGLEYGESRSVVPVGGGIPFARFYHPGLHRRLRMEECIPVVRPYLNSGEEYLENVCACVVCQRLLNECGDPGMAFARYGEVREIEFMRKDHLVTLDYPLAETKALCLRHYLEVKGVEYASESGAGVMRGLREAAQRYQTGPPYVKHLQRWIKALDGTVS